MRKMKRILVILLLLFGCDEPQDCNPYMVCQQAETCCDGFLYLTGCCDENCDEPISEDCP